MSYGWIAQSFIGVFGVTAVWLSQHQDEGRRRWAPIVGMCAQPFWFYVTWQAEQWGIFLLAGAYTYAWWTGIRASWIPTQTQTEERTNEQ